MLTAPRELNTVAKAEEAEARAKEIVTVATIEAAEARMDADRKEIEAAAAKMLAIAAAERANLKLEKTEEAFENYRQCILAVATAKVMDKHARAERAAVEQAIIEAAAANQAAAENDPMNDQVCSWAAAEIPAAKQAADESLAATMAAADNRCKVFALRMKTEYPNPENTSENAAFFKASPSRRKPGQESFRSLSTSLPGSSAMSASFEPVARSANVVCPKAPPPLLCPSQDVAAEVPPEFPSVHAYDE